MATNCCHQLKMMRMIFILLALFPLTGNAQKFMIKNGDTLLYEKTMIIHYDTLIDGNKVIYPGDTTYSHPCQTLEKRDGKIINIKTAGCLPMGYWIIENESGTTTKGHYTRWGGLTGTWKTFDENEHLIKETEYASIAKDTYVLREVEYKDGRAVVISEKTWFARFYLKNVLSIAFIILGTFFFRVPINMLIATRQFDQKPVFWFPFVTSFDMSMQYMIGAMFTFWWTNLKPENKDLGRFSNLLSMIALGGFCGLLIGLAISGELT